MLKYVNEQPDCANHGAFAKHLYFNIRGITIMRLRARRLPTKCKNQHRTSGHFLTKTLAGFAERLHLFKRFSDLTSGLDW